MPTPSSIPGADPELRDRLLNNANAFLMALSYRDCGMFTALSTPEFQEEFARNAGAADVCDVVSNAGIAPPSEMQAREYGTINDGTPGLLWADLIAIYTFSHEGTLYDQEIEFGFRREGDDGKWLIYSFQPAGDVSPH